MKFTTDRIEAAMLKRMLLLNAAFSVISGFLMVVLDQRIAALIGGEEYQLWPVGAMLLGFGGYLAWFATRRTMNSVWVISVIVSDFAWVIGTVILLAGWHSMISIAGFWLLAVIGAIVFLFAELQWIGLRRLQNSAG